MRGHWIIIFSQQTMQAYNLDRSGQKTDVSIAADSPEFSLVPLELV